VQEVFDLQIVAGAGTGGRHVHLLEVENELHNRSFVVPAT